MGNFRIQYIKNWSNISPIALIFVGEILIAGKTAEII